MTWFFSSSSSKRSSPARRKIGIPSAPSFSTLFQRAFSYHSLQPPPPDVSFSSSAEQYLLDQPSVSPAASPKRRGLKSKLGSPGRAAALQSSIEPAVITISNGRCDLTPLTVRLTPLLFFSNQLESVVNWRDPVKNCIWLSVWCMLCYYPIFLIVTPQLILIVLILRNYERGQFRDGALHHRGQSATKWPSWLRIVKEESDDHRRNLEFLQRTVEAYCQFYDAFIVRLQTLTWHPHPHITLRTLRHAVLSIPLTWLIYFAIPFNYILLVGSLTALAGSRAGRVTGLARLGIWPVTLLGRMMGGMWETWKALEPFLIGWPPASDSFSVMEEDEEEEEDAGEGDILEPVSDWVPPASVAQDLTPKHTFTRSPPPRRLPLVPSINLEPPASRSSSLIPPARPVTYTTSASIPRSSSPQPYYQQPHQLLRPPSLAVPPIAPPQPAPPPDPVVNIAVFENQRWWAGPGWISRLLPSERPPWSDITGTIACPTLADHQLPGPDWEWDDPTWQLDDEWAETDRDGWVYSDHNWGNRSSQPAVISLTRQRRWIRGMRHKSGSLALP
ncbi:integral peroxisomal membrane peroxin-domain-containing protein [Phlyctochytrium arcticum]|nr:integral peroxisomal membrane peroxin-domain-containing protein [Phlyctochytrium arcticum]